MEGYESIIMEGTRKRIVNHPNGTLILPICGEFALCHLFVSSERLSRRDKLLRIAAWCLDREFTHAKKGCMLPWFAFWHPLDHVLYIVEKEGCFSFSHYSHNAFCETVEVLDIKSHNWLPILQFVAELVIVNPKA